MTATLVDYYPGEIENRAEARGRHGGVPLPTKTLHDLRSLAASGGVPFDLAEPVRSR